MSPIATLLWVLFVTFLWVAIVAGIWMLVTGSDEYSPGVSRSFADE